jgi:hypothetical protein
MRPMVMWPTRERDKKAKRIRGMRRLGELRVVVALESERVRFWGMGEGDRFQRTRTTGICIM